MAGHYVHPEYPILSVFFGAVAVITDIASYDTTYFAPGAHIATGLAATCSVILFLIAMKEKYWKKK